ncbi:MAG: GDP-mannose 4,6-dehydratase, partial [Pseudorhodoplanes sp.]
RAFAETGVEIVWSGKGVDEKGTDRKNGRTLIEVDARYFRPTEVNHLVGDPSKARAKLGWQPRVGFDELVREMVQADLQLMKQQRQNTRS